MTTNGNTALAVREESYEGMTMAVAPAEAQRRVQELQAFVKAVMVKEEDYGTIPGTQKPSLFQPGAQKLAEIYGLAHSFVPVEQVKDWEKGFFYFEYRCIVTSRRDGRHICEGIGSCNSREGKYAERWVFSNEVPPGLDKSKLKKQTRTSKKNGAKYDVFQVPNEDPYSLVNTIQKMAAKRAYVHAIISATRSAGVFTQDAEHLPPEVFGKADAERSWEHDPETGEVRETPSRPPPADLGPGAAAAAAAMERHAAAASKLYDQRAAELAGAPDLPALKKVWDRVQADAKKEAISFDQRAELAKLKDMRKFAIEQAGKTTHPAEDDFPASFAGKGRVEDTSSGRTTFSEGFDAADSPPPADWEEGRT